MKRAALYLIFLALAASCKKYSSTDVSPEYLYTGDNTNLYDVQFLSNDTGFACGGLRNEYGFVYKTVDAGQTWSKTPVEYDFCAYSIFMLTSSTGWIGGDFARLYKTTDGGQTWPTDWFESYELAFHESNRGAIKRIEYLGDSSIAFVGGQNYQVGNSYRSDDMGQTWGFDTLPHELRGISYFNKNIGMVCGFGYVGKTSNAGQTWQQLDFYGDFFTGIAMLSENEVVACGNNGGIYKSTDGGNNWEEVISSNAVFGKRYAFNDLKFFDDKIGFAVGQSGLIVKSADGGNSWALLDAGETSHLNALRFGNGKVYIAANNGKILVLDIY